MSRPTIYVVSVCTIEGRAKELLDIVANKCSTQCDLVYVANTNTIYGIKSVLESLVTNPQVLISSGEWTTEQQSLIRGVAEEILPAIKTVAVPSGSDTATGLEAISKFFMENSRSLGQ